MTQGYPLDTIAYGIGFLPLIKRLKLAYSDVTQTWYAYDDGALRTFNNLERYFNSSKHHGPVWGYFPDPNKIILIVHPKNIEAGEY